MSKESQFADLCRRYEVATAGSGVHVYTPEVLRIAETDEPMRVLIRRYVDSHDEHERAWINFHMGERFGQLSRSGQFTAETKDVEPKDAIPLTADQYECPLCGGTSGLHKPPCPRL